MAKHDNMKKALALMGKMGAISDMIQESSYWKTQPNSGTGTSRDMQKNSLRSQGYTGTIADMEAQYWKDKGTASSHLYWRLNITANSGNVGQLAIDEIEMMSTVGGADQCNGGTATANSELAAGYTASTAFSNTIGGASNYWETSSMVTTGWICYQFPSPVSVAQYKIYPISTTNMSPKNWTLEYSDNGSTWTVAHTVTNETGWVAATPKTYTL